MIHENVIAMLWRDTWCLGAGDQNEAAEENRLRNQNRNRERERSYIKILVTGPELMRQLTNQPHLCPRHVPWCKLAFNLPNPTEPESTSKLKRRAIIWNWQSNTWTITMSKQVLRSWCTGRTRLCGHVRTIHLPASFWFTDKLARRIFVMIGNCWQSLVIKDNCGSLDMFGSLIGEHFRR